jgi:hypothetical protein
MVITFTRASNGPQTMKMMNLIDANAIFSDYQV